MERFSSLQIPFHHKSLQGKNIVPLTPPDKDTNTQACIALSQTLKEKKAEEIEVISRSINAPEYVVVIRATDQMVVLR